MVLELSPSFTSDYAASAELSTMYSPEPASTGAGLAEVITDLAQIAAGTYLQVLDAQQTAKQLELQRQLTGAGSAQTYFAATPGAAPVSTVAYPAAAPAEEGLAGLGALLPIVLILGALVVAGVISERRGPGAGRGRAW